MDYKTVLPQRIKQARKDAGMRRALDLAKAIGAARETVAKYETGAYQVSLDVLAAIASATGKPMDWFLRDSELPEVVQEPEGLGSSVRRLEAVSWLLAIQTEGVASVPEAHQRQTRRLPTPPEMPGVIAAYRDHHGTGQRQLSREEVLQAVAQWQQKPEETEDEDEKEHARGA